MKFEWYIGKSMAGIYYVVNSDTFHMYLQYSIKYAERWYSGNRLVFNTFKINYQHNVRIPEVHYRYIIVG